MKHRIPELLRRWFGHPLNRAAAPTFRPLLECLEDRLAPATFTVMNTNDSGGGSLRDAIVSANANPGSTIAFNIGGGGTHVIFPASALPFITATGTIIDASTQPGFSGTPLIALDGASAGPNVNGLLLLGGNSVVKGLTIGFFNGFGVLFVQGGNNAVLQDDIGFDPTGLGAAPNVTGVGVVVSNGNVIANSVISGNSGDGVMLVAANNNVITQNTIGLNAAGTGQVPNGIDGVNVTGGATGNIITNNTISGNSRTGVTLYGGGVTGNLVLGNTIGLRTDLATAAPNAIGVWIAGGASGNVVGQGGAGGNIIAANVFGVLIDDPGTTGNVVQGNLIGINGANATNLGNILDGVLIFNGATGNTIGVTGAGTAGNFISANGRAGVYLLGPGTSGNVVRGNYIGTNTAGLNTLSLGNADGVFLDAGASSNVVTANVISFNDIEVLLSGAGTSSNAVQGNYIGLDVSGDDALTKLNIGVQIQAGASGNIIGGPTATPGTGAGNKIGDNRSGDLRITDSGTMGNLVQGNQIGLSADGSHFVGLTIGVAIAHGASVNLIGGTAAGAANDLGGAVGVSISAASNNTIQGNFIGTNAAGAAGLSAGTGVLIASGSSGNLVGGTTPAARNVISGNAFGGVFISGSGTTANLVQGNLIGVKPDGVTPLGNTDHGVLITFGAANNTIGGTAPGAGNIIANSTRDGVLVGADTQIPGTNTAGDGNAIEGNSIYGNTRLGIFLGLDNTSNPVVANVNDASGHTGVNNNYENYPVLGLAFAQNNQTIITGTFQQAVTPNSTFRIEFFSSPTANASGFGEGKTFLGFVNITTDSNGNANFAVSLAATTIHGQKVSATATDALGNTSEFALDVTVQ